MAQPAKAPDRLPWLTEVPRAPPTPAERGSRRAPWGWVAGGLAILGVGAGAYWLGTRQGDGEIAAPTSSEFVPLPEPTPAEDAPNIPSVSDMTAADELTAEPETDSSPPPAVPRPERSVRSAPAEDTGAEESEPEAGTPPFAAAPPALPPIPMQPVVRGRIIQLGAYPTRVQADFAWREAIKRFPYLASKPRLISPLEVRSTDGKGTRMYRLQVATASQAQSVVICQQLESKRQSCVVVY